MKRAKQTSKYLGILFLILLQFTNLPAQTISRGLDAIITYRSPQADSSALVADIRRIGDPQGSGAILGSNWIVQQIVPTWNYGTLGNIFGIAIDNAGNVYFSATIMYNTAGNLGAASVAPVGVGFASAGSGGIYKAVASNLNSVTPFITTGTGTNQIPNGGYGIGNICYNKIANCLYASNLDDGKIYQISTAGTIISSFDPFTNNDGGAAIAPYGERITAVAVNYEIDGTRRLYYSVVAAALQSEIWSVELGATGNIIASTHSLEIILPPILPANGSGYISDMAFSVRGEMLVAERGSPHYTRVFQFFGRHNAWAAPQIIEAGNLSAITTNSAGGVDYGEYDGNSTNSCDSIIWMTANVIANPTWYYGLQSAPHTGYVNNPAGSYLNEAYIVDINLTNNDKNGFGDIEFYDADSCNAKTTDICSLVSASAQSSDSCCYEISIRNDYHGQYFTGISIETGGVLSIDNFSSGGNWGNFSYVSPAKIVFADTFLHTFIPKDSVEFLLAKLCFTGTGNDKLIIKWIGNAPQFDTVCVDTLEIVHCGAPVDTNCASIPDPKIICEGGVHKMQFRIKNNSSFIMRGITLYPLNPNVTPVTAFLPIPNLLPGQTSALLSVLVNVANNDSNACFFFAACDLNVPPGTSGQYPNYCCMDSIQYCMKVPACDPCGAIKISASPQNGNKCCYKLSITNTTASTIQCMRFIGEDGTQFAFLSSWSIVPPVSSNDIKVCAPGSGIGMGSFPDFADFCLTGTSVSPHIIHIEMLDANGDVICVKKLSFDCDLVPPSCASIVNDSLYCNGSKTKYSFSVKNNSPFDIYHLDVRISDTSIKVDQSVIIPAPPIAQGATSGPYTITITNGFEAGKDFCIYLSAHNNIYDTATGIAATKCCTDSLAVLCFPYFSCNDSGCCKCCDFSQFIIPTGITPNNDSYNDEYNIHKPDSCKNVKIVVYNRWGNIVYENSNYMDDWKGTNKKGDTLPQGTYFVVIELSTGNKKGSYIDIRY